MYVSKIILNRLLSRVIPVLKEMVKTLDSKQSEKDKIFNLRLLLWNLESDSQKELHDFIEKEIFTPTDDIYLPSKTDRIDFKRHKVMNTYFLN